jgi:hypothetical protein
VGAEVCGMAMHAKIEIPLRTRYDNVHAPLAFRYAKSSPPRWMSFNSFAWNCEGNFLVQRAPAPASQGGGDAANNYSIGHVGLHGAIPVVVR